MLLHISWIVCAQTFVLSEQVISKVRLRQIPQSGRDILDSVINNAFKELWGHFYTILMCM